MEKVVIMLTAYNGGKYIAEQIESILAQTFSDIVLLIRDDNSVDNTLEVISEYAKKDSRVILLNDDKGNLRQCKSFEELMGYAINHYPNNIYMFSDHDDYWCPTKIETELKMLMRNDPCLVYSNYEVTDSVLNVTGVAYAQDHTYSMQDYRRRTVMQNWLMGCTMMLNYELLKAVYPISNYADNHDQYVAAIASFIGKIVYCNNVTIKHRIHANNVTTNEGTTNQFNRIKRTLKRIGNRKKYFTQLSGYVNDVHKVVLRVKSGEEIEILDALANAIKVRGRKGYKIIEENGFCFVDGMQNKIFKLQMLLG